MEDVKQFWKLASDAVSESQRVGLREFLGLEQLPPDRPVDPSKCQCGGGCESVLECEFWYWMRKTPEKERGASRQATIGRFRVDSLFDCDGQTVVIELDGKEFHQDKAKDWDRDKQLLKAVDCVIHIPYAAMHFYPEATFSCLAFWYPRFELRAISNSCFSAQEIREEINKIDPCDAAGIRQWVDDVEADYEVWYACETFGFAASVKAWLARGQWNTAMIRRTIKHKQREAAR